MLIELLVHQSSLTHSCYLMYGALRFHLTTDYLSELLPYGNFTVFLKGTGPGKPFCVSSIKAQTWIH